MTHATTDTLPRRSEHAEQCALFGIAARYAGREPALSLLYAIPNGEKRDAVTGARLKAAGVRAGVLDIHLPVPRRGWCGLWIEMKAGTNKLTKDQGRWVLSLRAAGHRVEVCYGAAAAWAVVCDYLGLEDEL